MQCNILWFHSFLIVCFVCCVKATFSIDDNYGKTWIFIPDGEGNPQIAYLTEPPKSILRSTNVRDKVRFQLYSRKLRQPKELQFGKAGQKRDLQANDDRYKRQLQNDFDPTIDTKIIIHGWMSGIDTETVQNIKNNYLMLSNYNVIAVDWQKIAANSFYLLPARQTRDVGQYTAELIDYLVTEHGANTSLFHLIGHSLGAHTAGYASALTKSGRVRRISGLDPALPAFEATAPSHRLDPSDAEFVDVIHTCAGTIGYAERLGHVDFYPNSGIRQPGCYSIPFTDACSHGRSHEFYAESILTETGFYAVKCESWELYEAGKCANNNVTVMGAKVKRSAAGKYYLRTNAQSPFAKGKQ